MSAWTCEQAPWPAQPDAPAWSEVALQATALVHTGGGYIRNASGAVLSSQVASSTRPFRDGIYLNGRGDGDPNRLGRWVVASQSGSASTLCAVARILRSTSTNTGYLFAWGDTATATRCHIRLTNTTLVVSLRQATFDTPREETFTLVAGDVNTWAVRAVAGSGIEVYRDGVLQTPTSTSGTMPASTFYTSAGQPIWVGANSDYSAFGGHFGAALWFSDVGADVVRALSTDIYGLLHEPEQHWVPVSAAGGGAQTLTPDLFTNSNTFYTHTVTTGAVTLTPDLFTNTSSFYTPTVSSSYTVTPDLFTNTNTFYTPIVTNLSTLYPDLFTNSQTFYTHVVTGGGGQTLEPELFSNSATFYGPTITVGSVTLTASLFTNTNDVYTHTVTSNYPLTPDLFSNSSSFYTPTISVGAVTLTPSLFTNSNTFYTHTISNSSTTIYFWKRTA